MLFGTENQMAAWGPSVLSYIGSDALAFQQSDGWRWQRPTIDDLYGQFFRWSSQAPAFVWTNPVWFLTGRGAQELLHYAQRDRINKVEQLDLVLGARNRVRLGFGEGATPLLADLRRLLLLRPADRERKLPLVRVEKERLGTAAGKKARTLALEEGIGLASPGDALLIQAGQWPAQRDYYIPGERGKIGHLRTNVMVFGRLQARGGPVQKAWIHTLQMSFDRDSAQVTGVGTVRRSFDLGLGQFHGLREMLWAAVLRARV